MLYHHCMSLDFVSNAKLYANPYYTILSGSRTAKDDIDWRIVSDEMQANYWLEKQLGFYPHLSQSAKMKMPFE